jgi:hypothetical protein
MKTALVELISKISAGVMSEDEVARIADEAAQAYADPAAFLAANPDINYDDSFPIPLGEWVVVGSLPDTVLFQADTYGARARAAFEYVDDRPDIQRQDDQPDQAIKSGTHGVAPKVRACTCRIASPGGGSVLFQT